MNRIAIALMFLLFAPQAHSQEAACTALGANCICSEPLETSTALNHGGGASDSPTSIECWADDIYNRAPGETK